MSFATRNCQTKILLIQVYRRFTWWELPPHMGTAIVMSNSSHLNLLWLSSCQRCNNTVSPSYVELLAFVRILQTQLCPRKKPISRPTSHGNHVMSKSRGLPREEEFNQGQDWVDGQNWRERNQWNVQSNRLAFHQDSVLGQNSITWRKLCGKKCLTTGRSRRGTKLFVSSLSETPAKMCDMICLYRTALRTCST